MSKLAHYLQEHLTGEVTTAEDTLNHFSTDNSILTLKPSVVVYPYGESDVRKTMRFAWQLAERGRIIPVTPRGSGSNNTGAALGKGILMIFPAHMNRIVELESKSGLVKVEPGANYGKVDQTLKTHGQFLPPLPHSAEFSTIGGGIADNISGEKTVKYGNTQEYVKGLRVVLANGEVIETERLNKRDLNKKLGLATFEGEIYRAVDTLLEENRKIVVDSKIKVSNNTAGYNLADVKTKDGFDLTPLLVGSQGTLGIITEATLDTIAFNPVTTLLVGMFDDRKKAQDAIAELRLLDDLPSSIEMVDRGLLEINQKINPNQLKDVIQPPYPELVLIVEFDDHGERQQKKAAKKALKILQKYSTGCRVTTDESEQASLWKLRRAVGTTLMHSDKNFKALPIMEGAIVPIHKYAEFLDGVYAILKSHQLSAPLWAHAGDGDVYVRPYLDVGQVGSRQLLFRLMEEYYSLAISLKGSTASSGSDGRLRAPYLKRLYSDEVYVVMQKVKKIFDPYNILNPGVKMDVALDDVKPLLRTEYVTRWHEHLPQG
jgi:FAD/FMN-containing dehydrogenase